MLAKQIMKKRVVSLNPQMTLRQAADLFDEHDITGAPVVSPEGKIVGVLSQTDLTARQRAAVVARPPGDRRRARPEPRVEQAMTPWGVTMEEDTPVPELARQMLAKRIHRVILTRDGEICGIVSAMDVMRGLLKMLGAAGKP